MASSIWTKTITLLRWISNNLFLWKRRDKKFIEAQVQEILREIESESWMVLKQRFSLPIRILLPVSLLEKGVGAVQKSFGSLKGSGKPVIDFGWWSTTVKIPLTFQNAEYGMVLQMTPASKLVGLRFTSLSELGLGPGWQPPRYADEYARESMMKLGRRFKVEGTLCLPSVSGELTETSRFPCVVFLAGSGPCDRDSTVGENKPFKDLALGLARQGVASIRFDKVTHTHNKAFRKRKNITLTDEYVEHAVDAIQFGRAHPNIHSNQVFILGHSLGAVVAPVIAAMEDSVAGCIIMAGPAEPIYRCLIRQLRYFISLDGPDVPLLRKQLGEAQQQADVADSEDLNLSTPSTKLPFGLGPSYWLDYRNFKPIETVRSLKKPILLLQGDRDYQVTVQDDFSKWRVTADDNPNIQCRVYEDLNHLFIYGTRPSAPLEYTIPGNMDERIVNDIAGWASHPNRSI